MRGRCERTGKVPYGTEDAALRVIQKMWASPKPGKTLPCRAYQCEFCNRWHTTSQAKRGKPV